MPQAAQQVNVELSDIVTRFRNGMNAHPVGTCTWQEAVNEIKSQKHKKLIDQARSIPTQDAYDKFKKTKLPAFSFCAELSYRNKESVLNATGFIIPDLDHLPDLESLFRQLMQDPYIWFAFRSPGGDGIKCALRAEGISCDDDIKRFFRAMHNYFVQTYQISVDNACKDISRLTFISSDPDTYINPDPQLFDIEQWMPAENPPPDPPPQQNIDTGQAKGKEKYALKVLESCCEKIRQSVPTEQHTTRRDQARLIGGYFQYISEDTVLQALEQAVVDSGAQGHAAAMKTIRDGLEHGKQNPIEIPDKDTGKAKDPQGSDGIPQGFSLNDKGVYRVEEDKDGNVENVWTCSPLKVTAPDPGWGQLGMGTPFTDQGFRWKLARMGDAHVNAGRKW